MLEVLKKKIVSICRLKYWEYIRILWLEGGVKGWEKVGIFLRILFFFYIWWIVD